MKEKYEWNVAVTSPSEEVEQPYPIKERGKYYKSYYSPDLLKPPVTVARHANVARNSDAPLKPEQPDHGLFKLKAGVYVVQDTTRHGGTPLC